MNMNKDLEYLFSEIPIFKELNADDTEILSKFLFPKELPMGGLVCKEGQHGSFLSFVASGELEIVKTLDGKEVTISTITEGDSLGEMALIDGLTRSATVRAKKPSTILILRRDDFNKLLNNKFSTLQVYFQASNLFTLTKYPGLDPEIYTTGINMGIDSGAWPTPQQFLFGITFGL